MKKVERLMILKPATPPEFVPAKTDPDELFQQVKSIIVGYIAPLCVQVPMAGDRMGLRTAWVNEDAAVLRQRGNVMATRMAGQPIAGTMVVEIFEGDKPLGNYFW